MEEEKKEKVDIFEDDPKEESNKKSNKNKLENEIKALKEEIEKLKNDKEELNNKYLMSLAETKNYKRRMDEEMERFYKYSTFDIAKELVEVLDHFDLAIEKEQKNEELKAYLEGFKLTRNAIYKILEKQGVKEIESLGKEYDPNLMVSIAQVTDESKKDQEVVNVFMKGYMYKDRVLRAANVIINVLPADNTSSLEDVVETKEEESKQE